MVALLFNIRPDRLHVTLPTSLPQSFFAMSMTRFSMIAVRETSLAPPTAPPEGRLRRIDCGVIPRWRAVVPEAPARRDARRRGVTCDGIHASWMVNDLAISGAMLIGGRQRRARSRLADNPIWPSCRSEFPPSPQ
jgi:hypothetical protein